MSAVPPMRVSQMIESSQSRRKWKSRAIQSALAGLALIAILPLFCIFGYVLLQGAPALDLAFFTELPRPIGEAGGGMANAVAGTLTLIVLASLVGVPWGIAIGTWLSEYGHRSRLAGHVRFCADLLASVPSIILGLFVYAILVRPMHRFSAIAGATTLGLLMIPTICRTTEELLKMVPVHIREAGLALGLPRWKVVLAIVLRGSRSSIITGVMLSVARVAGETAPLLFTAFNNRFWQKSLDQPVSSLPVQIYTYAISPYPDWHRQAWAGAFVLVMVVFVMNLMTRAIFSRVAGGKEVR